MIETICKDCGTRYPLGTDHVCRRKPAAKKSEPPSRGAPIPPRMAPAPRKDAELAAPKLKRGRGRPPGPVPFDKKAHDRMKSAERRARIKAAKEPS